MRSLLVSVSAAATLSALLMAQTDWVRARVFEGRSTGAVAYDAACNQTVLFGEVGFADTWEWNGTNWTQPILGHACASTSATRLRRTGMSSASNHLLRTSQRLLRGLGCGKGTVLGHWFRQAWTAAVTDVASPGR